MTLPRLAARASFRLAFPATRQVLSATHPRNTRTLFIKSNTPPPFPVIRTCPAPTCACASPPELPTDLQIDREAPLNGAIPSYAQHVLICSGKRDWAKRIEEDDDIGGVVGKLGRLIGPKGDYSDPFYHTSTLASSFPPTAPPARSNTPNTSVYILPAFKYIPFLSRSSPDDLEALVRGYLRPETLHPKYDDFPTARREQLVRKPEYRERLRGVRDVTEVVVLICGHGGRDQRCGLYGPVLQAEFEKRLPEQGVEVLAEGVSETPKGGYAARVGQISHIGGHKFAGNVIVYIPPTLKTEDGGAHPLAGHGIWYGRVEPAHVEAAAVLVPLLYYFYPSLISSTPTDPSSPSTPTPTISSSKPLNNSTFTPFTILSREQISPTAFVLTVATPTGPAQEQTLAKIEKAWEGGLWALEVRQPECQVAREYTPLPTVAGSSTADSEKGGENKERGENKEGGEGEDTTLRFYIRRMDGGEVSGYLARLKVGEAMDLRGPWGGFDLRARLGALLDQPDVEMEVVWANRRREDCPKEGEEQGPIIALLETFRERYDGRFRYSCTVDEEGSFIDAGVILRATGLVQPGALARWMSWTAWTVWAKGLWPSGNNSNNNSGNKTTTTPLTPSVINTDACTYHSPAKLITADAHDPTTATETKPETQQQRPSCQCKDATGASVPGGKNLLLLSGPDGFIQHFAGEKVWEGGKERQGPVGGVIGGLRERTARFGAEWLVLKM
ncbi:Sucrase/ferredoxin-like-domain-containing protein [Dichotomopilus funicola]|uniref:Altered inheritance of mitochondria protein 32 n=1 Tax=Dichotomopilus funicola TaxID=1934379 RepID=A0AAN6VB58_9PEZI|nr:Sucrase/ferredoxin-like-domain-containing protein [Dichotomopilus funicola]